MGIFTFNSPAISYRSDDGQWIVEREGKGGRLRFDLFGGALYFEGALGTQPVGSIYINDGPTSSADPQFSFKVPHTCECGNTMEDRDVIKTFSTPSEAVEEAAFLFLA